MYLAFRNLYCITSYHVSKYVKKESRKTNKKEKKHNLRSEKKKMKIILNKYLTCNHMMNNASKYIIMK